MSNILLSEKNKELLWNILYNNQAFTNIPDSKFNNIKSIFESNIEKAINSNKEILSTNNKNVSSNDYKNIITQINKLILQNSMNDIVNYKKTLLISNNTKENYKNEKNIAFEKEYLEKKESFTNLMSKKNPESIDFSDSKDEALENNKMNELLEKMQKERNNDLPIINNIISPKSEPIDIQITNISNNFEKIDAINNSQNIEEINLNNFDEPITKSESSEIKNLNNEKIEKTKISNIEELLFSFSNDDDNRGNLLNSNLEKSKDKLFEESKDKFVENNNEDKFKDNKLYDLNYYKKRTSKINYKDIDKAVSHEYEMEFKININNKFDFLTGQIEKILNNQKKIMEKLNI